MAYRTKTADVVVVGGGIMGASCAYHLVKRGCRKVVILESQDTCGLGATGQNAGGIRHQFSTEINIRLSLISIAMLERFPEEMDQEIDLRFCGYLFIVDREKDLATFRASHQLQQSLGVPSQMLDPDEVARLAPQVNLEGILGAGFCPRDGLADPSCTLQGYLSQGRLHGLEVRTETPCLGLVTKSDRITGVNTPSGTISTRAVLLAAGPWSGQVARQWSLDIPVEPVRRQIAVTGPLPQVAPDFPFVIDFSRALYFHREGDGILTGMSNPDQAPGFDISIDEDWKLIHLKEAIRRMPLLADSVLKTEWAGLYEVTPDSQPILGALPHLEGLYACTGFSGHGFMHGPAAGLLMAEEILDGRTQTLDIAPLRFSRFELGVQGEFNVV